jgi:hypothetical protein
MIMPADELKRREETAASAAGRFKDVGILVENVCRSLHQCQDQMLQRANQRFDVLQSRLSQAGRRVAFVRSHTVTLRDDIGTLIDERGQLKREVETHKEDLQRLSGMDARVAAAEKTIRDSETEKEALQRTILDFRAEVCLSADVINIMNIVLYLCMYTCIHAYACLHHEHFSLFVYLCTHMNTCICFSADS